MSDNPYKTWLYLVYPDEAYPDWVRRVKDSGAEAVFSPLHSSDVWRSSDRMIENPRVGCSPDLNAYNARISQEFEDGKPKKPHYHLVVRFSGTKRQNGANEFAISCLQPDPPRPFHCDSIGGSVRYLIHYDDPDKEQFNISSITSLNGFDFEKYFEPTIAQEDQLFISIRNLIFENDIIGYFRLMDFLAERYIEGEFVEEFRYCRSHYGLIRSYADGRMRYLNSRDLLRRDDERTEAIRELGRIINDKFM